MRRWWKALGVCAVSLASLGGWAASASAQFPPPAGGMMGPGPGMPMMGPGPGMPMMGPGPGMPMMGPGPGMPPGMPMMGPPPGMNMGRSAQGMGMSGPHGMFGGEAAPGMPAEFPNSAHPPEDAVSPFTLKDDGSPNAFGDMHDPRLCRPLRWQLSFGYTILWFRPGNYPPLVTTGDILDLFPGALDQPSTSILSRNKFEPGPSAAFRTTLTYWVLDPERVSVEGNFFIMEQRSLTQGFRSDETGSPVLSRPYYNRASFNEDVDPRSLPGILKGAAFDSVTTRLMGAEAHLKWYSGRGLDGPSFNLLFGARWFRFDERYRSNDITEDIDGAGVLLTISDTFTTYNQFFGGQMGFEWQYKINRFTFGMLGKLAVGPTYQTIKVSGETTFVDQIDGTTITDNGQGLFAQPSNVGVYRSIRTALLPEFAANIGIDLTDHCRFNIGYTFLYLSHTVRPGDQIDRRVNIQPLLAGGGFGPPFPEPPTFRQSFFTVHMLNLGLEFLF